VKRIKAIYPGSFDPPTNGHLDLIERGSKIFDELVVAILRNPEKDPLFSVADRRKMLEAMTSGLTTFRSTPSTASPSTTRCGSRRGHPARHSRHQRLRIRTPDGADESQTPARSGDGLHDARGKYSYLSSRLVREVAQLGGSIDCLVPELVAQKLREKMDVAHKFENGAQPAGKRIPKQRASSEKRNHEKEIMSTVVSPVTHPVRLTERINRIEPSATMAVVAEADKLRQQGIDVVDFGAGEPHFSTPQHIKDAAIAAIQAISRSTPPSAAPPN
jgi:pantetheine-phosphate adenylyltransferase